MNTLSTEMPVGEIVARLPLSAGLFEDWGIDFCCGGRMALSEACRKKGLDATAILQEIERTAPGVPAEESAVDWTSAPLGGLVDHIVATHHRYMKDQLPRLNSMLEKILAKHGENHGGVLRPVAETYRAMKEELDGHLYKEETILFPLIRHLENPAGEGAQRFHCGSVQNPIRVMVMEHDSAGDALARLRELTDGYRSPDDACATYRAFYAGLSDMERDLHQHIHLENNILFPRAVKLEASI